MPGRADWTLVFAPILSKVTPAGEEVGLVKEGRGWKTGLGLHLKRSEALVALPYIYLLEE